MAWFLHIAQRWHPASQVSFSPLVPLHGHFVRLDCVTFARRLPGLCLLGELGSFLLIQSQSLLCSVAISRDLPLHSHSLQMIDARCCDKCLCIRPQQRISGVRMFTDCSLPWYRQFNYKQCLLQHWPQDQIRPEIGCIDLSEKFLGWTICIFQIWVLSRGAVVADSYPALLKGCFSQI